jgi:DNA excision repair protein ERCC-4
MFSLEIDYREQGSPLVELVLASGEFDVAYGRLRVGDYIVQRSILVERKTCADFVLSMIDGRLFRQAALMSRQPLRSLIIVEGPPPENMPDIHPHSTLGACLSLAVMWRQPVLLSRDPQESLVMLRLMADQARTLQRLEITRGGYKPKRLARRKLYVLQGLPGVGPVLAGRLLSHFGTVEKVMTAQEEDLRKVPGCGVRKASAIREILR